MAKKQNSKLRLLFTGFSMGLADLVPGVSGGTIALLYGIYGELLYSIRIVTGNAAKLLLSGKITQAIKLIPFSFLVPLFVGIVVAVFSMAHLVTFLLDNYPVPVWSLFFGLVAGAAYVVSKRVLRWNRNRIALAALGFVLTFIIVGFPAANLGFSLPVLFVTGAIATCAMILPGISGSLIMVILGQYKNVLHIVEERLLLPIVVFVLGAATGLSLFARLLSWLLHNHHAGTVSLLVGVLLGSLRKVWPWQDELQSGISIGLPETGFGLLVGVIFAIIGYLLIWQLEKLGVAKEHIDIEAKEFKQEIRTQHD